MPEDEDADTECSSQLVPKFDSYAACASCPLCTPCIRRALAWQYSVRGWTLLLRDSSVCFLLVFCVLALTAVGIYAPSKFQANWCSLGSSVLLAVALEGMNSIVEGVCDYVQPEHSEVIKDIKDMAAAVAAVGPVLVILVVINSLIE